MAFISLIVCVIVCVGSSWCQSESVLNPVTCPVTGNDNNSDIDLIAKIRCILHNAKVVLAAPENITLYLIKSTEAFVSWDPPQIYHMYDVNTTAIDPPFNESFFWLNVTYSREDSNAITTERDNDTTATNNTEAGKLITDDITDHRNASTAKADGKLYVSDFVCHSLDFFENYTIDFNRSEEVLNSSFPQLLRLVDLYQAENTSVKSDDSNMVSFSQGCVKEYKIHYFPTSQSESGIKVETVNASDKPEVLLAGLAPATNYTLYVVAVFEANKIMQSENITFSTVAESQAPVCRCDSHGVERKPDGNPGPCDASNAQPCKCQIEYEGQFCEVCKRGFYRTAPYFPCHRCPCDTHSSRDTHCYFREGFLRCQQCEAGYTGNICHMCENGYYRHRKYCVPCSCHGNHNTSGPMCDMFTGSCNCVYNTSGFNCERCAAGYEGEPFHYKNCTKAVTYFNAFKWLPQRVIAGVCVGIIMLLSIIAGCIIYMRIGRKPLNQPFWTVELKDNHEGVNFNSVPNEDFQIVDPKMTMDDQDFYENQGGAAQSQGGGIGGKKYARLQEQA